MNNVIENQSNKQNNKKKITSEDIANNLEAIASNVFSFPKNICLILGAIPIAIITYWVGFKFLKPLDDLLNAILGVFGISTNIQPIGAIAAAILACVMFFILAYILSNPIKRKSWQNTFNKLSFPDNTGENAPILIKDKCVNSEIGVHEAYFIKNGTRLSAFQDPDNCEQIGSKRKFHIVDVESIGGCNSRVKITYRKNLEYNPLYWNTEKHLQKKDFVLTLGQKTNGKLKTVNLNNYPHAIIAGSTGSGKSVLLSCLLAQSWLKGAKIVIAEFAKYGVDWSYWKNLDNCDVCVKAEDFADYLEQNISKEIDRRGVLFAKKGCKNLSEYNSKVASGKIIGEKLDRIIIALDEAGQVYTKTSDKEREVYLSEIREILNRLLSVARFVGIHIIFATQIPSSKILPEEVRHNADLRICGISNPTLSDVVIGSELASYIPKTHKGVFLTSEDRTKNNGFQGFLINEEDVLKK